MINIEFWKKRKKEKGLTFEQIASQADVSISALKDIFRGVRTNPRIETVEAIEKVLCIEKSPQDFPEGFMSFEDFKKLPYSNHKFLIGDITVDEYQSLSKEQQNIVGATIRTLINNLKK